jgi:membrane fusion protein, multidrug efflux system
MRSIHFIPFFAFVIGTLLVFSACKQQEKPAAASATPTKNPVLEVEAVILKTTPISNTIEVNGSLVAGEYVEIRPEVSGRLTYLNIAEGKTVQAGTKLARIYNEDLIAQQRKVEAQLAIVTQNEQRLKKLLDVNGINQQDYDNVFAQVTAYRADIEVIKAQLRKTEILAPFTGIMGLRNVSNGAYVTPTTLMATLQQVNQMKIDFTVPEIQAASLKSGGSVMVQMEGNMEKVKANIIAIEPQINQTTRNIKVRALLTKIPKGAAPGAFAKVYLGEGNTTQAMLLPSNAVVPDTRNKRVFLIKNGKAKSVIVATGTRTEDNVQVLSGVEVGDTVAVSGILYLRPDIAVKVKKIQ